MFVLESKLEVLMRVIVCEEKMKEAEIVLMFDLKVNFGFDSELEELCMYGDKQVYVVDEVLESCLTCQQGLNQMKKVVRGHALEWGQE